MTSDRTTLLRLIALCLALAPLPGALAYSETDLSTLSNTGSCAGCDLTGADLYEANLYQADLSGADLTEADLTAADLTLADLSGADLRGAVLEEANLSGTNLAGALLDQHALAGAVFDSERTRGTLGFKELKLGMNVVEIAQYCSITNIDGNASDLANLITARTEKLLGHCLDDADMPFAFGFSGIGSNGVLNSLEVGIAAYTEENHRKFIDLLGKKYKPMRSYSAADVAAFNKDRSLEGQSLDTIFANGQVTLSVVSRGTGLQLLLTYRAEDNGQRFLDRKGGPAPVDLAQLPAVATDLYRLAGNYRLTGISDASMAIEGRIDTAYLEIDVFGNELAGELAFSGFAGLNARLRITTLLEVTENWLRVKLEPVDAQIPDGQPLEMVVLFSKNGNSIVGEWTNWFILQGDGRREADDFKGTRSQTFWQTVNEHNRIDMYQAYLRLHPGGIYTAVARARMHSLTGNQAASLTPTSAGTAPSLGTVVQTNTPQERHPLAGIWLQKRRGTYHEPRCFLAIGEDTNGDLHARSWEAEPPGHSPGEQTYGDIQGDVVLGLRDLNITRTATNIYKWDTNTRLPFSTQKTSDMAGVLTLNSAKNSLRSNNRVCRNSVVRSAASTFIKQTTASVVAMGLPSALLADFPSPIRDGASAVAASGDDEKAVVASEEGLQIAKASAESSGSANSTLKSAASSVPDEALDPIAGVWVAFDGVWGTADRCFAFIGRTPEGALIGKSWEEHDHAKPQGDEPYADINVFSLRRLKITEAESGVFNWQADRHLLSQTGGIPSRLGAPRNGILLLKQTKRREYVLTSRNRLCRKSQHDLGDTDFHKLTYEETLALSLPEVILDGLPKPSEQGVYGSSAVVEEKDDAPASGRKAAQKTERR